MNINNSDAKKLVSIFGKFGRIVVGSYGRSSHEPSYHDLDFITTKSLNDVYKQIQYKFDKIDVIKNGDKYLDLTLSEKYKINIWKTNKENFYKTYMTRTLDKNKIIYINKLLKD